MPQHVVLLGPQRDREQVRAIVRELDHDGDVAIVTAGWSEREDDDAEVRRAVGGEPVNLRLHARWLDIVERDPDFAAGETQRRGRLDELQGLYLTRLHHAIQTVHDLRRHVGDDRLRAAMVDEAIATVRALDEQHVGRVAQVHARFFDRWQPHDRPVVAAHREDVRRIVDEAGAVAIAGGHVGVLTRLLHLFNFADLVEERPVVAWSAGAMAVAERVVLFHDLAPHGPGHAELHGSGLGLVRGVVPLPDAKRRLELDDVARMVLMARRFAPRLLVPLDSTTRVDAVDGEVGTAPTIGLDGRRSWFPDDLTARGTVVADPAYDTGTLGIGRWGPGGPADGPAPDEGSAARDGTAAATDPAGDEGRREDPHGRRVAAFASDVGPLAIDELRSRDDLDAAVIDAFLDQHDSPIVEGDRATFLFRGEAEAVYVQHRVMGLRPAIPMQRLDGCDLWYVVVHLPERSRVEYHLEVVRGGHGEHHNDPLNPHVARNPMGSESVARAHGYEVPDWTLHHDDARPGLLEGLSLHSRALDRSVHTQLYLPPRFRRTRTYPLLVVHDGNDYLEFAAMKTVLDNLIHRLDIAELVAVFTTSDDRLREYADDERHATFVVDELVAELEAQLPLVGAPRGRCLMGASFGGIASFSTALRRPGAIGNLLLQSTSFAVLDIGDDLGEDTNVFRPVVEMLQRYRARPTRVAERIYQTCGAYEPMIRGNRAMVPVLQATGSQVRYVEARDGHNWENWRDRLRDGLSWLFPGPQSYVYE